MARHDSTADELRDLNARVQHLERHLKVCPQVRSPRPLVTDADFDALEVPGLFVDDEDHEAFLRMLYRSRGHRSGFRT